MCLECLSSPELYDWLYLGFMASLPVIIHWFFIDFFIKRERKRCSTNLMLLLALTFFPKELLESKNVIFYYLLDIMHLWIPIQRGGGDREDWMSIWSQLFKSWIVLSSGDTGKSLSTG